MDGSLMGIAAGSGDGRGNSCISLHWRLPVPGTGGRYSTPHKRVEREKLCKVSHVSALHG